MNVNVGYDWVLAFMVAIQRFLSGGDPYAAPLYPGMVFVNPPWLLPLIAPFGFLGAYGAWGMILVGIVGLMALCHKLKKPWLALLIAFSYPMFSLAIDANVDGFVLLGLAISGPVGFFLLSVKPQVACFVGLVWMWQEYKRGGWISVFKLVSPTILIALIFTARYPQWVKSMLSANSLSSSLNLWPWLVPVGICLVVQALRKNREELAGIGTTLISPYLQFHSYLGAFVYLSSTSPLVAVLLVAGSWIYPILTHIGTK